jgi:hypothetical protein
MRGQMGLLAVMAALAAISGGCAAVGPDLGACYPVVNAYGMKWAVDTSPNCNDRDGGLSYYAKGVTEGLNGQRTDRCVDAAGNYDKDWLREYYCNPEGYVDAVQYECVSGCADGACKYEAFGPSMATQLPAAPPKTAAAEAAAEPEPAAAAASKPVEGCSDSDGGVDYLVRGVTAGRDGEKSDRCVDWRGNVDSDWIREYYCSPSGYTAYAAMRCSEGCVEGACRPPKGAAAETVMGTGTPNDRRVGFEPPATASGGCDDTDGGKTYGKQGTVTVGGNKVTDACAAPKRVKEWFCLGDTATYTYYTCTGTCVDGTCV